ncbi:hypothetical protein ACFX1Z_036358 [Malus domestica]
MDSEFWTSRLAAAKRQYSTQHHHQSSHFDRLSIDDFEVEDEVRPDFPCPYCYEDFDIASLCSHLEDEHSCESKVTRRRRLRRVAIPNSQALSLLGRDLREAHLQVLLGSGGYRSENANVSNAAATDPFLSSLILNFPASGADEISKSVVTTTEDTSAKNAVPSHIWKSRQCDYATYAGVHDQCNQITQFIAFLSSPKGVNNDNESGANVIRTVDGEEDYPMMPIVPDYCFFDPSLSYEEREKRIRQATGRAGFVQDLTEAKTLNPNFTPTSVSYSKLLSQCTASKSVAVGREIHAHMIRFGCSEDPNLPNHLVNLYSKCRFFGHARKLVDESPEPDLVSWSALISGYAQNGLGKESLSAFREMHSLGVKCNEFTFPSVLKACSITRDLGLGKQVHAVALFTGFEFDEFVANTLVVMYAKCREFGDSRRLFDAIPERNVVSWNALFSCYVQSDFHGESMDLFQEMILSGVRPNEYIKSLEDAATVFEKIAQPDIVSWNAVIAGCVLHEYHDRALKFFRQMKGSGIRPNMFTLSSALKACAGLGSKKLGRQLHSFLIKMDTESDSFVNVGLIDMYCKCEMMKGFFDMVPKKDMIAWNAVISGHSQNGEDIEAVSLFSEMYKEGGEFNQTTLSTVLKATASVQAIDVCEQVHSLSIKTGFESDMYVINSLLDTYGKCGRVEDAARIFKECPIEDVVALTSMITAYSQYEQGEEALKLYLQMLERENKSDSFVCSSLLNACANLSA